MRLNEKTSIIGKSVKLVPYKKEHVEKYHEWMIDPILLELTASEPLTLDEEFENQKSWHQDPDKLTFIILYQDFLNESGDEIKAMVGDCNVYINGVFDEGEAEIEIMIAESNVRGKGLAIESLNLMMKYVVQELKIHTFIAKIKHDNIPSRVLFQKKLNFKPIENDFDDNDNDDDGNDENEKNQIIQYKDETIELPGKANCFGEVELKFCVKENDFEDIELDCQEIL